MSSRSRRSVPAQTRRRAQGARRKSDERPLWGGAPQPIRRRRVHRRSEGRPRRAMPADARREPRAPVPAVPVAGGLGQGGPPHQLAAAANPLPLPRFPGPAGARERPRCRFLTDRHAWRRGSAAAGRGVARLSCDARPALRDATDAVVPARSAHAIAARRDGNARGRRSTSARIFGRDSRAVPCGREGREGRHGEGNLDNSWANAGLLPISTPLASGGRGAQGGGARRCRWQARARASTTSTTTSPRRLRGAPCAARVATAPPMLCPTRTSGCGPEGGEISSWRRSTTARQSAVRVSADRSPSSGTSVSPCPRRSCSGGNRK